MQPTDIKRPNKKYVPPPMRVMVHYMNITPFLPLHEKVLKKEWGFGGEGKTFLKSFSLSPKIKSNSFPAEPCTRRNGTLFSRAVLCARLYCSQRLTSHGDKSTGGGKEVCKPWGNFIQAPLISCRSQSSGYHELSRFFYFCYYVRKLRVVVCLAVKKIVEISGNLIKLSLVIDGLEHVLSVFIGNLL